MCSSDLTGLPGPSGRPGLPTASTGLPRSEVLPALSGLVGKSILSAMDGPGDSGPRYRMLETVRTYGLERLAEAGRTFGQGTRSPPTT